MKYSTEVVIIGAGVIGIAIGRALSMSGFEVVILEQNQIIGSETSARNSEVIHSGIYYKKNSLKAKLCLEGNKDLYLYSKKNNIPHKQCGKLIVANTPDESNSLHELYKKGTANGLSDLKIISSSEAKKLEENINCIEALYSPSTGIIDSHTFIKSILTDFEKNEGILALKSQFISAEEINNGIVSIINSGGEDISIFSKWLINAGGLNSYNIVKSINSYNLKYAPKIFYAKGTYFTLTGKAPFSRLIYPLPSDKGLGIHYTIDINGYGKFGPDIEWVEKIDYSLDENKKEKFIDTISKYFPALNETKLQLGYSGIRPKISGPNQPVEDFLIQTQQTHNVQGLINLFGIESPGLTSSLSIASEVLKRMKKQ
ncbi:NAD(P)/FAD-dependent oxidoreductase [Alphaproteobacteria bacterium]|nr:NAD(P)/FAD-dependent oxidoreductase [Alphaproteobacteria bacterium]